MTRATLAAGALTSCASFVAGATMSPSELGAQFVERRHRRQRLDPVGVERRLAHGAAENHEFLVVFGERHGGLGRRHRIARMGDQGRTLEQGADRGDFRPFRAIWARRFLATWTEAPACFICLRRRCIWATVKPEYCATTTTAVFEKTSWRASTASFFSALSTLLSPVDGKPRLLRLAALDAHGRLARRFAPVPGAGDARRRTEGSNPIAAARESAATKSGLPRLCRPPRFR